jgi:hypothetical protein
VNDVLDWANAKLGSVAREAEELRNRELHRLLHLLLAQVCSSSAVSGVGPFAPLVRQGYRLAHRISENRIVAGVHFEVDLWAGRRLGVAIADTIAALAGYPAARQSAPELLGTEEAAVVAAIGPAGASALDQLNVGENLVRIAFDAAAKEWTDAIALHQAAQAPKRRASK